MRPKVVLIVMGVAALVLVAAVYFKQGQPQPRQEAPPPPAANDIAVASNPAPQVAPVAPKAAHVMTPQEKQDYTEAEIKRLEEWSRNSDPASYAAIINDLTNSVKEVRLAAIEATKQLGNRDAIPVLKADVANTPDTDTQIALLQAADFLALPTIAEVQQPQTPDQIKAGQDRQAQATANKIAQLQQQLQMLQQQQAQQQAKQQH